MDTTKTQDTPKKCFCARCFLPIDEEDKVDVEGQNFHRICSTCCVCRTIPKQLKMFYGHVFCAECFKKHVLTRFRDNTKMHTDSWWMQFAPGVKAEDKTKTEKESKPATEVPPCSEGKKRFCARCLQPVDDSEKLEIGGQSFHPCCAKCCACQQTPKDNIKIYFGQVFCDDCFNKLVVNRTKDNTAEFFKCCFEQWQTNPQFAAHVQSFMASNSSDAGRRGPVVFVMQGSEQACRRDERAEQPDWFQNQEPKKSAVSEAGSLGTWGLSCDTRTEVSDAPESSSWELSYSDAEKIEKLTKYLGEKLIERTKKMQKLPKLEASNCEGSEQKSSLSCPKCLWQWGTIYVNRAFDRRSDRCVENFC